MKIKEIEIKCGGEVFIPLSELNHFQGKLKSITEGKFKDLKNSLVKNGLTLGFHIWKDIKGKIWILDGHHRLLAFNSLESENYIIPELPCNYVNAKTKKEAAKALLISNSRYARMSQESLSDFMIDNELGLEDLELLDIPELDMNSFVIESPLDQNSDDGNTKIERFVLEIELANDKELNELYDNLISDGYIVRRK